jgi:hypothetical protein
LTIGPRSAENKKMGTFFRWCRRLGPGRGDAGRIRSYESLEGLPNLAASPLSSERAGSQSLSACWILYAR